MKNILWITVLLVLAAFGAQVAAIDYGPCYTISNPTARQYCLARKMQNPQPCYSISQNDEKQACLAEATGNPAWCYDIQNADKKAICLAK